MKRPLLTIAGVLAGYATTALLSVATTTLLRMRWPQLGLAGQGPRLERLDAAYALLFMGVGGYAAARFGGRTAAWVLCALFGGLGAATAALGLDPEHTMAYQWTLAVAAAVVVLAGARFGLRRRSEPAGDRPLPSAS